MITRMLSTRRLLCLLMFPVTLLANDDTSQGLNLEVQDWRGQLLTLQTNDGSTLAEYKAQTQAVEGASETTSLWVSFIPRFGCSAQIGLTVPSDWLDLQTQSVLFVDELRVELPTLSDQSEEMASLSYSATGAGQEQLLQQLDSASQAVYTLQETGAGDVASEDLNSSDRVIGPITFSLLGSKATTYEMRQRCYRHVPEIITQ